MGINCNYIIKLMRHETLRNITRLERQTLSAVPHLSLVFMGSRI